MGNFGQFSLGGLLATASGLLIHKSQFGTIVKVGVGLFVVEEIFKNTSAYLIETQKQAYDLEKTKLICQNKLDIAQLQYSNNNTQNTPTPPTHTQQQVPQNSSNFPQAPNLAPTQEPKPYSWFPFKK